MNDETAKHEMPEIDATASKADLKAAADDILKAAKQKGELEANDENEPENTDDPVQLAPEQKILMLETEKEEIRDQLLRAFAEMENVRKRAEREKLDARTYAIEKFARDLLSVYDNLARALDALPEAERTLLTEAGANLLGGVEMTQKELRTVLTRHGVTLIEAGPGAAFDPNLHQAVAQVPSEQDSGAIASLFQVGWRIGDRVLRAAMVAVSAGQAN